MNHSHVRLVLSLLFSLLLMGFSVNLNATGKSSEPSNNAPAAQQAPAKLMKGIYVTQANAENTAFFTSLIKRAKAVGITTFIVDLEIPSKVYEKNVALLKDNDLIYVARIIMFPDGGTPTQINSEKYWQRKFPLVERAISYGAQAIQLDYIRYNTKHGASSEHAKNIHKIISWYKAQLDKRDIPLEVDVFGISSFGEEKNIGQNIKLFADTIDTICPMVYPSHFTPFAQHVKTPYETVYGSLVAVKGQFNNNVPIRLIPYIELSNYHYPLSRQKKLDYIYAQIRAAQNAGADGWYAWSPHNEYDNLFRVMESYPVK